VAKGGLAAWSIHHPVSTGMLVLTIVVLGFFAIDRLAINLLPQLIYPQIGVRVLDAGVSASIMEDRITRQLEEQLSITEDVTSIESETSEGTSRVDLFFQYGKDIDIALRDASTRLDRAKRFLPDSIDPPIIFKMDPAQIPVMVFVASSNLKSSVELREWADHNFRKRFLNLPGVAAVEIGGGLEREIQILVDQRRLAGMGLSVDNISEAVQLANRDEPSGRLLMSRQEYTSRTAGRFKTVGEIASLPIRLKSGDMISLSEVAQVVDTQEDERLRVRYNGIPGVKLSIQKQPNANTVEVSDLVKSRLAWLKNNGLIPEDVVLHQVSDQARYVRNSLSNATMAAVSGALLAMLVVYAFLGNIRGTLIIGTAIPISILVTFVLMALAGLTFNVMTLGGLALGIGMLIDNTIVMLENIARHKKEGSGKHLSTGTIATIDHANHDKDNQKSIAAAGEVNSAIVAATSTNLAAVLPFLFIGGLVGLLFRELIFTITAAIIGSLFVALTLVPSLAARMSNQATGKLNVVVSRAMTKLQGLYRALLESVIRAPRLIIIVMFALLVIALTVVFTSGRNEFLPAMDDGRISLSVTMDTGISLDEMDEGVVFLEQLAHDQGDVEGIFTLVGGRIFGRTERTIANKSSLKVQLVPLAERNISAQDWAKNYRRALKKSQLAGVKVRVRVRGIRGVRTGRSDDDIGIAIQGPDLDSLSNYGEEVVGRLQGIKGIRNIKHSMEDKLQEFAIKIDRERAAELEVDTAAVGKALKIALEGIVISDYLEGDRNYPIRIRLPKKEINSPDSLGGVLLFGKSQQRQAIYLRDVAFVELIPSPATITRIDQIRGVEITASLSGEVPLGQVTQEVKKRLADLVLPGDYNLFYTGTDVTLKEGTNTTTLLTALALFLVFVVMSIQYESLKNPAVIMVCVPFAFIGVAISLVVTSTPMSMPVWLGIIMLVGIVVNNAIVLVEYIELMKLRGLSITDSILEAGKLRLRPILMTTLTTVVGMLPLAIGIGSGAEMLQPLAITIVGGLSFSMIVSLLLLPVVYSLAHDKKNKPENIIGLRPVA